MPWRALCAVGAIAILVLIVIMFRSNWKTDAILDAVRDDDTAEADRLLTANPELVTTPVGLGSSSSIRRPGERLWKGRTLLHQALSDRSTPMADTLLEHGADLSARVEGDTLLHLAAASGYGTVVAWLLDHRAEVNARNGCEHPERAGCISGPLAKFGPETRPGQAAVCTGCQHEGRTPLHAASGAPVAEAAVLLLSNGAAVDAIDARGRTPLHLAALAGSGDTARVLCAYGADPAARDADGKTPQQLALEADAEQPDRVFTSTGPGELAGWLAPGGGCASIAARASAGQPVPTSEVDASWRAYTCLRDPAADWCQ